MSTHSMKFFMLIYTSLPMLAKIYEKGLIKLFIALALTIICFAIASVAHKIKFFVDQPILIFAVRLLFATMGFLPVITLLAFISRISINTVSEAMIVKGIVTLIIATFILIMTELLIRLVSKISDPRTAKGLVKLEAYANLIVAFIVPLLLPNFVFGFSYQLSLISFYNINLSLFDSYYLSFVINYTMPLGNQEILNVINLINLDKFLNIIQIVHVTIVRIIDLTIIAIVIEYIKNLIKK